MDNETPSRVYAGIASPGRGPKLVFLRTLQTILAGSAALSTGAKDDPADPYLTALCYFNALRELGGARRIVDDEVRAHLTSYGSTRVRKEPSGCDRIDAPWVLNGPVNANAFLTYVEKELVKTLSPKDIVVLDNLGSHKGQAVRQAIRRVGARIIFLPPYSPDLRSSMP